MHGKLLNFLNPRPQITPQNILRPILRSIGIDPKEQEESWNQLVGKVQDYATRRRVEANLVKGKSAMDVDGIDGHEDDQWGEGYYDDWGNWFEPTQGDVDALVVSEETRKKGDILNALRKERKLGPVEIIIVPMKMASDGNRISSTRIRNSEIDSSGNILVD